MPSLMRNVKTMCYGDEFLVLMVHGMEGCKDVKEALRQSEKDNIITLQENCRNTVFIERLQFIPCLEFI